MYLKKPSSSLLQNQVVNRRSVREVPKSSVEKQEANKSSRAVTNSTRQNISRPHLQMPNLKKVQLPEFPKLSLPKISKAGIDLSALKIRISKNGGTKFGAGILESVSAFCLGFFRMTANIAKMLLGGSLVLFGSSLSGAKVLFSFINNLFLKLIGGCFQSLRGIFRFVFVLACRWMKIHGAHSAPSTGIRRMRMVGVVGLMAIMSAGVVLRLYALQGTQHGKWNKIALKQHGTGVDIEGARGVIADRNGIQLAVSIPALKLGIHPKWIKNKQDSSEKLAQILEVPKAEIEAKLKEDKNFTVIAKGISTAKKQQLEKLRLYGLEIEEEFNRVYPQGDLASTIVGKAGNDGVGLSGVERALNASLSAANVRLSANRDARGRLMSSAVWQNALQENEMLQNAKYEEVSSLLIGEELRKEGNSVSLTLDSVIQRVVEEEFDKSKETSKAKNVFGLMMDAETGEILAMGQTSRYNPNSGTGISPEALRNVVLQNSFEPGSTFKPIVAALALDKKLTSKLEMINCENGKFWIGKRMIKDAHPVPTVTFEQVIVRSSNIGMAKLGFRMGKDNLYQGLFGFGFGQKTGLELSGESSGIMRHSNNWAQIDVATHSFGQGVSVTALQMVRAYSALANGGTLVSPVLLKSKVGKHPGQRIITQKTADTIKTALNLVTEDEHGTGKNSRIAGVPVYGKTGTAQKAKENGKGYDNDKILASFVGFVDGRGVGVDKTLVLYVAVDEPGVTPRWGGTLAAPVFKAVMERTLTHLLSQKAFDNRGAQFVKLDRGQGAPRI